MKDRHDARRADLAPADLRRLLRLKRRMANTGARGEWDACRAATARLIAEARRLSDDQHLAIAARGLIRLGDEAAGRALLAETRFRMSGRTRPDWAGEAAERLVVVQRNRDIDLNLRTASALGWALGRVGRIELRYDPRFLPLFRRTWPALAAHDRIEEPPPDAAAVGLDGLAHAYLSQPDRRFVPLVPDPARTATFRARYGGKAIGTAWHSKREKKSLPPEGLWRNLYRRRRERLISLQYDDDGRFADVGVETDPDVDQMADLDAFAAQVAALDGVIAISNSTAHMAGALGIPCIVIVDDQFMLQWPGEGDRVWCYPSLRIVRRRGRLWREVFAEAEARLDAVLDAGPTAP